MSALARHRRGDDRAGNLALRPGRVATDARHEQLSPALRSGEDRPGGTTGWRGRRGRGKNRPLRAASMGRREGEHNVGFDRTQGPHRPFCIDSS